jgi:hypothetical protein
VDPRRNGCRQHADGQPYRSDTAQGTQASGTRQGQYCTENFEKTIGRRRQLKPEHKNGIRNRGLSQLLQSKREFNKTSRKTLGLEFVKQAVGMSSRLRKVRNWTLWRVRPPSKRKKNLLAALV